MAEFTGERVIPGQVDPDLWNEHFARYAFAARLARGKRVLDIGCGTGYGTAELASMAKAVTGIDVSSEAVEYAAAHYNLSNVTFEVASAEALPFADGSFDLVVAFEVIEHLEDYKALLRHAKRLLAPGGQFIVSTPNKSYYEETRQASGPNPYHVHEFEFEEFQGLLSEVFPHVSLFLQNHTDTIVFQPHETAGPAEVRTPQEAGKAAEAHFFIAVCAMGPQMGAPTFVYLPSAGNVLRERERHIGLLQQELRKKTEWLEKSLADHGELVKAHAGQTEELKQRNLWAAKLNEELGRSGERVVQLQEELAAEQKGAAETVARYEAKIVEMDADIQAKVQWALETERRLTAELREKSLELARCVEVLHETEGHFEERTRWALELQGQVERLNGQLSAVSASRWYRMGRTLGLGPDVTTF